MDTEQMVTVNRWNYQTKGQQRLLHGVYAPAAEATSDPRADRRRQWLAKVKAVLAMYEEAEPVLYGPTALQVLGVALPHEAEDWERVHIMVQTPAERRRRNDVVSHIVRGLPVWRRVDGLPVLHPVAHWVQMSELSVDAMVQIGDGFLRRRTPLLSLDDMRAHLDALTGRPGVKKARCAMELVRAGTDSIYESKTRLVLVRAGLPTPAVNLPVWCESVGVSYHVDLGYAQTKVAVEYDGRVHVGDHIQMEIDADRRRNLQDAGWMVINVTAAQLRHPAEFIRSVENALVLRTPAR